MAVRRNEELEQLRGFTLAVFEYIGVPGVPREALEPVRTGQSLRGFREAARDMVEMCDDLTSAQIEELDARLAREGLPTLSRMRDRRYRQLLTVLGRGRIRSDAEFRLLNGCVSDVDCPHLSEAERATARDLMLSYESSR